MDRHDDPYVTYENKYIETLWYLLKELMKKDLLYKGYSIQPYSPAAGSGLSTHELNQPGCYRDVKDTTAVAQFKVIRDELSEKFFEGIDTDVFILAWTTTPWTLPSNTALSVGKKIEYCPHQDLQSIYRRYDHGHLASDLVNTISRRKTVNCHLTNMKLAANCFHLRS